jgi:hypothetical protein
LDFEGRYPFTAQAKRYLQELNVEHVTEEEIKNAETRVDAALKQAPVHESNDKAVIVSYALSRILLAAMNDEWLARQYAQWESKRATEFFKKDSTTNQLRVATEFFPSLKQEKNEWTVTVAEHASAGADLSLEEVENGLVHLDLEGLISLFERAIENKVKDLQKIDNKKLPPLLKQRAIELRETLPKQERIASQYEGKHIELDCIKSIREGVGEGKRYYGCMAVSIACAKDGLTQEQARDVVRDYATACQKGGQPYTASEALNTLAWVMKHSGINLSCKTMKEQGLIDSYCSNCITRPALREKRTQ